MQNTQLLFSQKIVLSKNICEFFQIFLYFVSPFAQLLHWKFCLHRIHSHLRIQSQRVEQKLIK
jgi:hypothetical protein